MSEQKFSVADIYCGAGGLSAGFAKARPDAGDDARFEIVYGVDNDCDAVRSFRKYHFDALNEEQLKIVAPCKDIRDVDAKDIREAAEWCGHQQVDILIGGPNCQGVSAAGLRNPNDERNLMLTKFVELVVALKPTWFVMENVPGLTHANNRRLLRAIFEMFEEIECEGEGYRVSGEMLLAARYGVPQLRYRLFIVGTRSNEPIRFPQPTYEVPEAAGDRLLHNDRTFRTVKSAIATLTKIEPQVVDADDEPQNLETKNHFVPRLGKRNKERVAHVEAGGDWRNMPLAYLPERYFATRASDQKGAYGRLRWDWPAYTITNATSNVTAGPFTHPEHDRPLSVREAARLQSFDEEHEFFGSVISQYRQVGNAVPPKLAQALAERILHALVDPESARKKGREGRITLQVIEDALEKKEDFPTMTPRQPHPLVDNLGDRKRVPPRQRELEKASPVRAWRVEPRPTSSDEKNDEWLRRLAEQPGNFRAAKRARVIVQFLNGEDEDQIVEEANVAEASIKKWVDGYFSDGLDGWRAYHTPLPRIANYDQALKRRLQEAVDQVRRYVVDPSRNGSHGGAKYRRLHMNAYLASLKQKYSCLSVQQVIAAVEEKLGYGVGTVYVDDLLAIADTVLDEVPECGKADQSGEG